LTFFVSAPIFVWREIMRHRMASYNEESGRYKVLDTVFYLPGSDRKLVQVGKTGEYRFIDGSPEQHTLLDAEMRESAIEDSARYHRLLDEGIAKEVARMNLPLNIYSSAWMTLNARSVMNFLSLRVQSEISKYPSFPQREIEMVAEAMEDVFAAVAPLTHRTFIENGRVAP
jgi:thymidylate synthase (FAD)